MQRCHILVLGDLWSLNRVGLNKAARERVRYKHLNQATTKCTNTQQPSTELQEHIHQALYKSDWFAISDEEYHQQINIILNIGQPDSNIDQKMDHEGKETLLLSPLHKGILLFMISVNKGGFLSWSPTRKSPEKRLLSHIDEVDFNYRQALRR